MGVIHSLRDLVADLFGVRIIRQFPFGNEKHIDLRERMPGISVRTILDVGANVGQSAEELLSHYPDAGIHSCEPVASTFAKLNEKRFKGKVTCHHLALGSEEGTVEMTVAEGAEHSVTNSIGGVHPSVAGLATRKEVVQLTMLDTFCLQQAINQVDYLKIDTEGHDLEVLKGATGMLRARRIGVIDVEVGMNATNKFHVPLSEVTRFLEGYGYHLFGLYDQLQEFEPPRPMLRRCNGLFTFQGE